MPKPQKAQSPLGGGLSADETKKATINSDTVRSNVQGVVTSLGDLLSGAPGVAHLVVSHDLDCPGVMTGEGCVCNPTVSLVNRSDFLGAVEKTRQQRRAAQRAIAKAARKGGAA